MLIVVSLVATIIGLLTWIRKGFGFHALTLQLILRYLPHHVLPLFHVTRSSPSLGYSPLSSSPTSSSATRTFRLSRPIRPALTPSQSVAIPSRPTPSVDSPTSPPSVFRSVCSPLWLPAARRSSPRPPPPPWHVHLAKRTLERSHCTLSLVVCLNILMPEITSAQRALSPLVDGCVALRVSSISTYDNW